HWNNWDMASAVERLSLNPYEFGSLVDSDTGSKASRYKACIALSRMVGMPSGRSFPLALGMKTLRSGRGLYPRHTCPSAFRRIPSLAIDYSRSRTLVLRNTSYRIQLCGQRAGQHPLQGF